MYGNDHEYAASRLNETIVQLDDGTPVFIHKVSAGMKVQYAPLKDMNNIKVCLIGKINLRPVKLGFCNYRGYAAYLARYPMRRDWRQGLRRGNFGVINAPVNPNAIDYEELNDTIQGKYPSFEDALNAVEEKRAKSMAWNRHWAVAKHGRDITVMYKNGKVVGLVKEKHIVLEERYSYLQEALQEAL